MYLQFLLGKTSIYRNKSVKSVLQAQTCTVGTWSVSWVICVLVSINRLRSTSALVSVFIIYSVYYAFFNIFTTEWQTAMWGGSEEKVESVFHGEITWFWETQTEPLQCIDKRCLKSAFGGGWSNKICREKDIFAITTIEKICSRNWWNENIGLKRWNREVLFTSRGNLRCYRSCSFGCRTWR